MREILAAAFAHFPGPQPADTGVQVRASSTRARARAREEREIAMIAGDREAVIGCTGGVL